MTQVIAYQGNLMAINTAQWLKWLDESINIVSALHRDSTPEMIQHNRDKIESEWRNIYGIPIHQL